LKGAGDTADVHLAGATPTVRTAALRSSEAPASDAPILRLAQR